MSNQVYSNADTQYAVQAPVLSPFVSCTDLVAQNAIITNLTFNNPQLDNSQVTPLIWDFNTSEVKYADNMVNTTASQTLTNKTLITPVISQINNGQNITVPANIASQMALQSVAPQTTDNIATYFNTSPQPAVLKDSGIAISSIATTSTTQTFSNKSLVDNSTFIVDSIDNTKRINFDVTGLPSTTTTLQSTQTSNRIITLPDASGQLPLTNLANGWTGNNTFLADGNIIRFDIQQSSAPFPSLTISPGGTAPRTILTTSSTVNLTTITLPDATTTLLGTNNIATIQNKTINSTSNTIQVNGTNINSLINQDVRTTSSPSFTGLTSTSGAVITGGSLDATQIRLTIAPTINTDTNLLIYSAGNGGRIDQRTDGVFQNTTQTLSGKSFIDSTFAILDLSDNTKIINFNAGGTTATTTTITATQTANRIVTLPDATTTLVGTDTTQTLSNKTLTLPTISSINNGGTITIPSGADTFTTNTASQTLSNKTIANLVATGTSQSLLSGKVLKNYATVTTVNATPTLIFTSAAIPTNTAALIDISAYAFCSAGTDANKAAGRFVLSTVKNVAGTVTVVNTNTVTSQNDMGLNALAVTIGVSGTSYIVSVTGLAADTFNWSVVVETNSQ